MGNGPETSVVNWPEIMTPLREIPLDMAITVPVKAEMMVGETIHIDMEVGPYVLNFSWCRIISSSDKITGFPRHLVR